MPKFNDRIFGSNVDQSIINIFKNLQQGSFDKGPNDSINPYEDYLGDRTTFARMWTAILVQDDESDSSRIIYHIVNDNRDESYVENITDPLGDNVTNELTSNNLLKPKAGITSLTTKTEGALGAVKRTTVEFLIHNKNDFESIFLPFFLKPGATVVVDFGWSDTVLYDVTKIIEQDDLELRGLKEQLFGGKGGLVTGPDGEEITKNSRGQYIYQEKSTGNYVITKKPKQTGFVNDNKGIVESLVGQVVDYTANVNAQGSYECSLSIVSTNTSLLDAEITYDNKLKFIFENKMEQILVSALSAARKYSGEDYVQIGNSELEYFDKLSSEAKDNILDDFFNKMQYASDNNNFLIGKAGSAIRNGIFYQNVLDSSGGNSNKRDMLYISYGLFEDLFLNSIIAQNTDHEKVHEVNYNSQDTFVRYEPNLVLRQNQKLKKNEALSIFLYPEAWDSTYNTQTLPDKTNSEYENQRDGDNQYGVPIIPFRELFISVSMIGQKFASKQNVNDALISIIEEINKDSYGVFKLKMISLNDSFSSIGLVDANLVNIPEQDEETLVFDITSDKSIVYNMDYKFGMPKGGLASMISIGEKGDFAFFDDENIDNLNFTRVMGPNKEIFGENASFKSLPLIKKEDQEAEKTKASAYDYSEKTKRSFVNMTNRLKMPKAYPGKGGIRGMWQDIVKKATVDKAEAEGKKFNLDAQNPQVNSDEPIKSELIADSDRDYYGRLARLNTVLSSDNNSVPPILPIELSLTTYGNTYLSIGDFITINFLPSYYMNRVIFQILNIEQKVGTNWETTYSTVMRLRPQFKSEVARSGAAREGDDSSSGETLESNRGVRYDKAKITEILAERGNENVFLANASVEAIPINLDLPPQEISVKRVLVKYDSKVAKSDEGLIAKGLDGDSRIIFNQFGDPSNIGNLSFMYAVQATLGWAIDKGVTNTPRGKGITGIPASKLSQIDFPLQQRLNKSDIFHTSIINDLAGSYYTGVFDFLGKIDLSYTNKWYLIGEEQAKAEQVARTFAKKKEIKQLFDYSINSYESPARDIQSDFGQIVPNLGFTWTHESEAGTTDTSLTNELRYYYIIDVDKYGEHRLIVPDWFFQNSFTIVEFITELRKKHNSYYLFDFYDILKGQGQK